MLHGEGHRWLNQSHEQEDIWWGRVGSEPMDDDSAVSKQDWWMRVLGWDLARRKSTPRRRAPRTARTAPYPWPRRTFNLGGIGVDLTWTGMGCVRSTRQRHTTPEYVPLRLKKGDLIRQWPCDHTIMIGQIIILMIYFFSLILQIVMVILIPSL